MLPTASVRNLIGRVTAGGHEGRVAVPKHRQAGLRLNLAFTLRIHNSCSDGGGRFDHQAPSRCNGKAFSLISYTEIVIGPRRPRRRPSARTF